MTSETRLLIEVKDIAGIEFACQKCGAKVLYPLNKHYDRLAEQCPNCFEGWFITNPQSPEAPRSADGVKKVIVGLQKLAESELIRAQVRLWVSCPPSTIRS